jgi:hypothetical protein
MIEINKNPSRNELIVFAGLLGLFLGVIGYFCHKAGNTDMAQTLWYAMVPVAVAGVILVFIAQPGVKYIYMGWMYAVFPIGWTVTHLVLALVYYLVLTPIGLAMKLFGYDPMQRTIDKSAPSYWTEHDPSGEPARYFRQF